MRNVASAIIAFLLGISFGENIHNLWHGLGFKNFGNLADWAMVGVTAVTLYFLYQQFVQMQKQTDLQKKVLDSHAIQNFEDQIVDCIQKIANLFHESIRPASRSYCLSGYNNQSEILDKYTKAYRAALKADSAISMVSALKVLLANPHFDMLYYLEDLFAIKYHCNRLRKLYALLKQMDHQNFLQDSLYDECNAFAEEFLKRLEEIEQSASSAVTPAQAVV